MEIETTINLIDQKMEEEVEDDWIPDFTATSISNPIKIAYSSKGKKSKKI